MRVNLIFLDPLNLWIKAIEIVGDILIFSKIFTILISFLKQILIYVAINSSSLIFLPKFPNYFLIYISA
jgi:hypothetical protein